MRSNNRKRRSRNTGIIIAIVAIVFILTGAGVFAWYASPGSDDTVEQTESTEETVSNGGTADEENSESEPENGDDQETEVTEETFTDIRISAVGDVMGHLSQIIAAHDSETDTYDFNSVFEDVKPFIEEADLALANLETTLAGPSREYSGYPTFNAPDELADALKYAGFDTIVTTNNHSLDTREEGLRRTAQVIKDKELDVLGTYESAPEPDERFLIKDIEGIKVAILAYTEHLNGMEAQYSDDALHSMVNMIDEDQMITDIENAKAHDPDIIVAYMHWGAEYTRDPNEVQTANTEILAREGVDIIFGGHPHVIHEAEFIEVDGNEAFVAYSLGNFVSNQRRETLGEGMEPTEDGVIVNVDVQKNEQTGETTVKGVDFVPTWVYRHSDTGSAPYTYRILPVESAVEDTSLSENVRERLRNSYEETMNRINMTNTEVE